jgi:probable HAF family extracellular repeat protein
MRHVSGAVLVLIATVTVSAQSNEAKCSFENFRVPVSNVYDTAVNGINRGQTLVGMYTVLKKYHGFWAAFGHGFMLNNGKYYPVDVPDRAQTQPFGLNDLNEVVGDSWPGYSGPPEGFLLNATGYHPLNFPGYYDIFPYAINNKGHIVGMMTSNKTNGTEGFLFENGRLHVVMYPGSSWTYVVGTNEAGDIVGNYETSDGGPRGFVMKDGNFSTLDYPGADQTYLWAINDKGVVIGSYLTALQSNVVFFTWQAGKFQDLPNDGSYKCQGGICPNPTTFVDLNDSGQFAGNFAVAGAGYVEGFVATCR